MKTNAILRIVLFGVLIVVLLTILLVALAFWVYTIPTTSSSESELVIDTAIHTVYAGADTIQDLEIEWAAGTITIFPSEYVTQIEVQSDLDTQYQIVCKDSDGKLEIQFPEDSLWWETDTVDLTIYVPMGWACNSLEIDAADSNVYISDLTIQSIEYDGASGQCTFSDCTVTSLDLDIIDGDVYFYGSLTSMECDAVSTYCYLELDNTPNRIELDCTSATLDLTLPEDCGFTVTMDALNSDFFSDFPTTQSGGNYVYGTGDCQIQVDGLSGSVYIFSGGVS